MTRLAMNEKLACIPIWPVSEWATSTFRLRTPFHFSAGGRWPIIGSHATGAHQTHCSLSAIWATSDPCWNERHPSHTYEVFAVGCENAALTSACLVPVIFSTILIWPCLQLGQVLGAVERSP